MELNSAGRAANGSSEDVKIENKKKLIKIKVSKLHPKLQNLYEKLDGSMNESKTIKSENVPSTSGTLSTQYVAPRGNLSIEKIKIKEKISNVKKKFAKINMKLNGVPDNEDGVEGNRRKLRNRAYSERSSVYSKGTESCDFQRSQSVTISTTSLASTSIMNDEGKGFDDLPKKSKKKRKRRGEKSSYQVEGTLDKFYDLNLDNEFKLNAETFLILDLLSMPEEDRQNFLLRRARAHSILVENPTTHNIEIHPKIEKLRFILHKGQPVWELNESVKQRIQIVVNHKRPKVELPKKDKARPVFEELVNSVVHEGLTEEQMKEFTFPVIPKKQRTKNYYCTKTFNSSLEEFAQKCVNANLGVIIEGEIRVNAKNNDQAFIKHVYGEKDAMFISQLIRKCALHGDIVRAFIRIKSNENNKEQSTDANTTIESIVDEDDDEPLEIAPERSAKGFVIEIIEEVHNRRCVGSFLSYRLESEYITFVPRDMKMANIRIYRENWPKSFTTGNLENIQDVLYVALITEFSGDICIGKILQAVGKCGELEAENTAILLQNKLAVSPYEDRFNEMFYGPLIITAEERKKRRDLTSECIFTIDPLTARDLDDAMSCKRLSNGNYEIGVHISDVSYFLEENSELDRIVRQRTTSVYMVNEVFHMLPKPLCLKCSLLPGEEKLAYSVVWEINPDGEILNTQFFRSIINSCTQLAYEHAQKIIDFPNKEFTENDFPTIYGGFTATDIVETVKVLHSIALKLRKERFDNGALRINRPKLYFDLDPATGAPVDFGICQMDTANFLIEEYMLLANRSVAKFTYDKFPDLAILRNHEPPLPNVIKDLKERLNNYGLELDISSSKSLYDSLIRLVKESKTQDVMEICLSNIISKPMTRARYFCSDTKASESHFWHYALSIPIYTHFTSPIRRYPDVLVHRVLGAALDYTPPPKLTLEELQQIAGLCNEHKFNAKSAGDDSSNLYFLHYIKSKKFLTVRAAVLDMYLHAMEVILVDTGHVVRIPYPKEGKANVKFTLNNKKKPYTAQLAFTNVQDSQPQELKMFSEILVEVYVEKNKLRGRIAVPKTSLCKDASASGLSEPLKENTSCINSTTFLNDQAEKESKSQEAEKCVHKEEAYVRPAECYSLIEISSHNDQSSLKLINNPQGDKEKSSEKTKTSDLHHTKIKPLHTTEFINSSISSDIFSELVLKATQMITPLNKNKLASAKISELLSTSSAELSVQDDKEDKSIKEIQKCEKIQALEVDTKDCKNAETLMQISIPAYKEEKMSAQTHLPESPEVKLSGELPLQNCEKEQSIKEILVQKCEEVQPQDSVKDFNEEETARQISLPNTPELKSSELLPMPDRQEKASEQKVNVLTNIDSCKASEQSLTPPQELPQHNCLEEASDSVLNTSQELPMHDALQVVAIDSQLTVSTSEEFINWATPPTSPLP